MDEIWEADLSKLMEPIIGEGRILTDVPMNEHTSMRVGGKVKMLLLPTCTQEVIEIKKLLYKKNIPHYIMGNGTNLVVADKGYSGVLIKLADNFSKVHVQDTSMRTMAGTLLSTLAGTALHYSLSGLEFASGIPGTAGGAVAMNAGAYDGEMKDVVVETLCVDTTGQEVILQGQEHEFGYRTSRIQKNNLSVLEVKMKLESGDYGRIKEKMRLFCSRRKEKQPLNLPSAGSVFKRPEGCFAGKLIEDAGLKGYRIGGAQVSKKHCGFIVNTGNATAEDVLNLIDFIRRQVYQNAGVMLEPEVKVLGG